jgi:hypothetical protein
VRSTATPTWIPAATARLRTRPGERPHWLDASGCHGLWPTWREHANQRGVPLDVLVSVCLEYRLVSADLEKLGIQSADRLLAMAAAQAESDLRLPPSPALRTWSDLLAGRTRQRDPSDELPEVVVPERVAIRFPRHQAPPEWCGFDALDQAVTCELAAAVQGMSLEGWALRAAIAAAA